MRLKAKKSHQERIQNKLEAGSTDMPEDYEIADLNNVELLTWLQRLMAVDEYRATGHSDLIEAEAKHLKIGPDEVIVLYRERIADIKNPLRKIMTNDLLS